MAMLDRYGIDLAGKHAVVIGRSSIVGKPMALMLLERHATVTICHSRTRRSRRPYAVSADILVAAVGRPEMVTAEFVKPGAVVIDVGINRTEKGMVGDVRLRFGRADCELDHARAGRGGTDDASDAGRKHRRGRREGLRGVEL